MASIQHRNRSASVALAAAALSLALTGAVTVSLGACAGPRWMGRGPAGYQSGGMPGGTMMGPGMGGYGRGMRGYGAGMPGYGPGMIGGYGPGMRGTRAGGGGYLMWAISDGGAQLGSGMPAFAGALSDTDRWRIIHYLRTL